MAVMAVWAAVLITYGVSKGIAMGASGSNAGVHRSLNNVLPLDMAPDSVDDMYHGCNNQMKAKVLRDFLQNEKNNVQKFKNAWEEAKEHARWRWRHTLRYIRRKIYIRSDRQFMAIRVYTSNREKIYDDFNTEVRAKKSGYKTSFQYHTLHFFLTSAVQTLNRKKRRTERCVTGYRRTDKSFSQDVLNKEIRLGSFTSSSRDQYLNAEAFGNKSCFEIYTCFGADISRFSEYVKEREVLIPPYEVFKVTEIKERSKKEDPCDVMYKLMSTRTHLSNLNCAFFK